MSWTDERIDRLKTMWAEGATASQIADELGGVSRNAVIGKAHRLGLERGRRRSSRARRRKRRPRPPAPKPPSPQRRAESRRPPPQPSRAGEASTRPVPAGAAPAAQAGRARHPVSLGRPRRLHPPGPRRQPGADPAGAAAPAGPGQAERRGRRQDQPARSQRPHLPLADGPSRRARLPFLRRAGEPRLPYCVEHCGVAYQAQLPRRDRRPPPPLPFGGPRVR